MTIPASQLVDITPRVIGGGLSGLAFVGTIITKNVKLPTNTAVPFYSQSSVGSYFGTGSDEYTLAGNYFSADSNAATKPQVLWFFKKVDSDIAGWIRGASNPATLAELKAITAGAFTITIDSGSATTISGLNFSSATSFSAVATTITNALTGAVCTWNTDFNAFVITSSTTGASSKVSALGKPASGTDISSLLGLSTSAGVTVSVGAATTSLTATMDACVQSNSNFYSFMPLYQEDDSGAIELATWCNNQGVRFLYVMVDSSNAGKTANNTACLAYQVADYYGVAPIYNTKELGAMTMGVWAALNPQTLNGRKTIAYKQGAVSATVSDETDAQNLLGNGYNFYGDYATASNEFKLYQNGQISGNAKWQDTYYGQVFIRDGLQNSWINALMNANTIPYNQAGYGVLRAAAMDTINTAVNAGFIREGVSLSETQKAQVYQEAGLDISGSLETQGWYLQILDPTTTVRAERGTPVVNFWYMDGGSVQRIQGTSTVLL